MAAKSIAQPTQRPQRKRADHDCVPRVSDENQNEFAVPPPLDPSRSKTLRWTNPMGEEQRLVRVLTDISLRAFAV